MTATCKVSTTANDKQQTLNTMDDNVQKVIELLISWKLPQLCNKFREEEICTNALWHLNDNDIVELIPRIGPRAIFRAALQEWKQQQQQGTLTSKNIDISKTDNNLQEMPLTTPVREKQESISCIEFDREIDLTTPTPDIELEDEEDENDISPLHSECFFKDFNLLDILSKSFDGRQVLKYFEFNKNLDASHRRVAVKSVISAVIENGASMTKETFLKLAKEFTQVFPGEKPDTYYKPRCGGHHPKGALFYKYINMNRTLRRDGLLERTYQYRNNSPHS